MYNVESYPFTPLFLMARSNQPHGDALRCDQSEKVTAYSGFNTDMQLFVHISSRFSIFVSVWWLHKLFACGGLAQVDLRRQRPAAPADSCS